MKAIRDKASKVKVAVCIAGVTALALACLALANCSSATNASGHEQNGSAAVSTLGGQDPSPSASSGSEDGEENGGDPAAESASEEQSGRVSDLPGETTSQDAVSGVSGGVSQSNPSSGNTAPTTGPAASGGESPQQRTWVPDFEDVWVEDAPAWDESVPVYGSVEVSICNVCGADVTGNAAAHGKQHMLVGEGSGHHSEVREVVVGHDAVHHDASGHWERVESGGRWE